MPSHLEKHCFKLIFQKQVNVSAPNTQKQAVYSLFLFKREITYFKMLTDLLREK